MCCACVLQRLFGWPEPGALAPVASDVLDKAIQLSKSKDGRSGQLKVSGLSISGDGQILAEQSVLQDRAYWEVAVESLGSGLTIGVVGPMHAIGSTLGEHGGSDWVISSMHVPGLAVGSVIGVALDQSDYPVRLRFFHNGALCSDVRGPVTEAMPILELNGGASVTVNFGEKPFMSKLAGFEGIMPSQSLI